MMRRSRPVVDRLPPLSANEYALAACAILLCIGIAAHLHAQGLLKALTDQSSHLNFARLTIDSITPGVSQLGFWPPLLHVLLIPFITVPYLYQSGLAGICVLLPCLVVSTILLQRIVIHLTHDAALGMTAGLLFLVNPYILYYAATPMMEVLFITNIFLTAFALLRWMDTDRLQWLALTGIAVSLACLSRFEGFVLFPITTMIIGVRMYLRRADYHQTEALLVLFGTLAVIGVGVIMIYSSVYGQSPVAFAGGSWLRDPSPALRASRYSILNTLRDSVNASSYMLSLPVVIASVVSAPVLCLLRRCTIERSGALLVLLSPLLFVLLALFMGFVTITVPPDGAFNNDRYGLTWIGFAIVSPLLLFHELRNRLKTSKPFVTVIQPGFKHLLVVIFTFMSVRLFSVAFAENFSVIRDNVNSPLPEQVEVASYLRTQYGGGRILAARVDNDPILAAAGIPLNQYLYEGNFRYFEQAVREPWFFAQWVLMHNPEGSTDGWVEQNEPVYRVLGTSTEFLRYYDPVLRNGKRSLFRLNENHLLQLAKDRSYNLARIPSLNPDAPLWSPSTVYAGMERPRVGPLTADELVESKPEIRSGLLDFYWGDLKPLFANGVITEDGKGNSESQSYALLQSLWVDDPDTFAIVWEWTKSRLQQSDGLFAWTFHAVSDGTVVIDDPNSATDADTDIAYALLLASKRWSRPQYADDARKILDGIWNRETGMVQGKRHLTAGNWAMASGSLVFNPSYFSPAAYRLFSEEDPAHDWLSLIPTGYDDLVQTSTLYEERNGVFLPPDWAELDIKTGAYRRFPGKADSLEYSFDAFRVFWRIAEDALTSKDPKATEYLTSISAFDTPLQPDGTFCTVRLSDPDRCFFHMGGLAGPVSLWTVRQPERAKELLRRFAVPDGKVGLPKQASFYEKSWYWFMLRQWSHAG
ncbi:MAG: glycosyl hydrolase family 8 [Candidatus Peribacteraceae bacterium]|nr:glycosyl hydrolase family 8 [Candidatus Peribacteraceae bacterium]